MLDVGESGCYWGTGEVPKSFIVKGVEFGVDEKDRYLRIEVCDLEKGEDVVEEAEEDGELEDDDERPK